MIAHALKKKIVWSTFVQYAAKLLQIAIGIVTVKVLTNALGTANFGVYGKITEFALFFSVLANLGIFGNVVRKMADHPTDGKLFVNALILRIGTALIFFMGGIFYALLFIESQIFMTGLLFLMASLLFDYVSSICQGMLQANYRMGRYVSAVTLGKILELAMIIILSRLTPETSFYFLAPLAGSTLAMLLSLAFVRAKMNFIWELDTALIRTLFFTALPFGIINIINNLYYRFLPSFFAGQALSDSQFGSYNLILSANATIAILSTFLMYSALPALKQALVEGKLKRAKDLYKISKRSLLTLGGLAVVFGSLLGPWLLRLISSREFIPPEMWFVLPLFLVLTALSFLYDLVLITLFALEKEVWFLSREGLALIIGGTVLTLSLLPDLDTSRLLLVLLGAILGEAFIVLVSLKKIRELL